DELGRAPAEEEIARSLKMSKKKLGIIKKALRVYNSSPQADDGDGASFDDMITEGSHTHTPALKAQETDEMRQVLSLLDKMDAREAAVLRMRFGLDDQEPRTLKEIGTQLGLTRERVRQIEREALGKMRERLECA